MPFPRLAGILLLLLIPAIWYVDTSGNDNITSRAAMVTAIAEHGELHIDRYKDVTGDKAYANGNYYSEKAPVPSLLMVPVWWLLVNSGIHGPTADGTISPALLAWSGVLIGSLPFILIILSIWKRHGPKMSLAAIVVAFFGSFLFLYSGSFFGHLLAAFFMLLAYYSLQDGRLIPAGALAGAAVLCEYSLFVFPLIWIVQQRQSALRIMIGGIPFLLLLLLLNWTMTGSPWRLPYSDVIGYTDPDRPLGFDLPSVNAAVQLLFSPYRGLFVFAPIAIGCAYVALVTFIRRPKLILVHPLVIPGFILFLMISAHSMWWGGWAWGPRHLTTLAVLLMATTLPAFFADLTRRKIFWLLASIGLALNIAPRISIGYSAPTDIYSPIAELLLPVFRSGTFASSYWTENVLPTPWNASIFVIVLIAVLLSVARIGTLKKA